MSLPCTRSHSAIVSSPYCPEVARRVQVFSQVAIRYLIVMEQTAEIHSAASEALTLEPTPLETKRYQRQKLAAMVASTIIGMIVLGAMAFWLGPPLGQALTSWLGDQAWLRLIATACVLGAVSETLTLPLDFWSGYVLEHRYQLSNQSLRGWIWKRVKGYLVGGILGLMLLSGLYWLLWTAGAAWWLW